MNLERQLLESNEQIRHRSQPHWIIFSTPCIFLIISVAFYSYSEILHMVAWMFCFMAIMTGVMSYLSYTHSHYLITNKRVIAQTGWWSRHIVSVMLDKIESTQVQQGMLARILNYGNMIIIGTGGSRDIIPYLNEPYDFREKLQSVILGS